MLNKCKRKRLHTPKGKHNSEAECHTCTDDAVRGELLHQGLHGGVTMGVELPAGDAQVKPQPWRVAVAAAVPVRILVAILAGTHPE